MMGWMASLMAQSVDPTQPRPTWRFFRDILPGEGHPHMKPQSLGSVQILSHF
jgi:hypothetical protein